MSCSVLLRMRNVADKSYREKQNIFYLYNKNQLDALFILSLFRQSISTCFGHICSPSSGGVMYIYNNCGRVEIEPQPDQQTVN